MTADAANPKSKPEAQKHVYLRERMGKYNAVLGLITFVIASILPLILGAMSRIQGWLAEMPSSN
jgi:hypothetical protein